MDKVEAFNPNTHSFDEWLENLEDHLSLLDIAEEKHPGWLRAWGGTPIKARLEGLPTGATFEETKVYLMDSFTTR